MFMKLTDLKAKCEQLGLSPVPTKKRCNPDRLELSVADCTKVIRDYYIKKLRSEGALDLNFDLMLNLSSPMLASLITQQTKDVQDDIWSDYNNVWQFQRKYNGIRLILIFDGVSKKLSVFSRAVSEETLLPIDYSSYFKFDTSNLNIESFIIDVEMVYRDFEEYDSRSIKDDFMDTVESGGVFNSEEFKFVIIDTLMVNSIWLLDDFLSVRSKCTDQVLSCLKTSENGYVFESVDIKPDNMSKEEYYYSIVDNNGEGVIAKNLNSTYEFKRSNNWVKIKPKVKESLNINLRDTIDAFVSGYEVNSKLNLIDTLYFSVYLDGVSTLVAKVYLPSDLQTKVTRFDDFGNIIINKGFYHVVAEFSFDVLGSDFRMQHPKLLYWRLDKDFVSCSYSKVYFESLI